MNPLSDFIDSNYFYACKTQRSFEHDLQMINMHKSMCIDKIIVKKWMRDYGLFQGITNKGRDGIVDIYSETIFQLTKGVSSPNSDEIAKQFNTLLLNFYGVVPRKWISAVSKLLWCSYPSSIVIYDAFVHRSLIILQGFYPSLANMPRLSNSSKIRKIEDIQSLVNFYIDYQSIAKELLNLHQSQFNLLRNKYSEQYEYDIRILDKLLWLLGGPGQSFKLGNINCT
tara:strand:- start:1101 stop:1778 length:678 start_codon:yes stop_codon:yes gene_type:complete